MGREELIEKIREQDFPRNSYVVFGSGPLAAARIRKTQDIDMVVSRKLFDELRDRG